MPRLSAPDGVFVIDESGFPKQGTHSVGVAPHYCGTLGNVANCQMGGFLAYVSARGHAVIDARLLLPRSWTDDPERCRRAGVPTQVTFTNKADLGLELLRHARLRGHLISLRRYGCGKAATACQDVPACWCCDAIRWQRGAAVTSRMRPWRPAGGRWRT